MKKIEGALQNTDLFIPSYQEAVHYAGSGDLPAIRDHFARFPLKVFGVKLGASGVYLTDFSREIRLPSLYEGRPVDTTGAGDAFFAGFLAAYLKGCSLRECGLIGSAQAASVMRSIGANRSAGTWEEAMALISARSGQWEA